MAPMYSEAFDAHTHLDFPAFDPDRSEVISRARAAGVGGWAIAGADPVHWSRVNRIAEQSGGVATVGLHPWWVSSLDAKDVDRALQDLPHHLTPHGLGEIGLDWIRARDATSRQQQITAFRAQLSLARERDLPVVLHCVRAFSDLFNVLAADGLPRSGGFIHAFSGSPHWAEQAISVGLHLSFGPLLLRPNAHKTRAALQRTPLSGLLVETDCPDWPLPDAQRGEPADVLVVLAEVARLLGRPLPEVVEQTSRTAHRLFRVLPSSSPMEAPSVP